MSDTTLPVGSYARDVYRRRVGRVIGHMGDHVQLAPVDGGQSWHTIKDLVVKLRPDEQSRYKSCEVERS